MAPRPTAEDAILEAANRCFERSGVRGTTIEDIAAEAQLSRATLYRYFASKAAIVDRVSATETARVGAEIRQNLSAGASATETLVECLLLATRIAHRNPCVRALVEAPYVASRSADPRSPQHRAYRNTWGKLIEKSIREQQLARDLDADRVANWLVLSLAMLLIKVDSVEIDDTELRAFIERFVVRPLLPGAPL